MTTALHSVVRVAATDASPSRLRRMAAVAWVPLSVFIISRIALAALMWAGPSLLAPPRRVLNPSALPATDPLAALGRWTAPWFRFDAGWYAGVVQHGYHWGHLGVANTNFMPLFPIASRIIEPIAGSPWLATWLVANVSFAAALVLTWIWAIEHIGHRTAFPMLLVLAVFPFGFFYSAPYAEGPFLALAVGAFLLAERDRWEWAIVCTGAATVTRPVGLAVVLALTVLALQRGQRGRALESLLACLPLAAFATYLEVRFGHPFAFMTYHTSGWIAPHGGLLATVGSQFHTQLSPFDRVDAFLAAVFLAGVPIVWKRLGPAYAVFSGAALLLPLLHGLAGMERYVIVVFPIFAVWASSPRGWVRIGALSACMLCLPLAVAMYSVGYTIT